MGGESIRGKPHLLVIMMYWYPYEGPIPAIYAALFERLLKEGYRISLIASFPHYRFGRRERWAEFRRRVFECTDWNGINLYRVWVFAPEFRSARLSLFFRSLNYLSFSLMALLVGLAVSRRTDIILVPSSPPLLGGVVAGVLGKLRGIPFVYNVQDLYPDNLAALGVVRNTVVLRLLDRIERRVYRAARWVVPISSEMKDAICRKGISGRKVVTIPNFHDTERIMPMPRQNAFSAIHGLNGRFVVSYIGGVSYTHGLEFVIEAASMLTSVSEVRFVIIGRGEYLERIKQKAEQKDLGNVLFFPEVPYQVVNEVWAASDASLVCLVRGASTYQVPSKTFGIMASGRPVIAMVDEGSEIWRIVEESGGGVCVPPECPEKLARAIRWLYENPEQAARMGRNGRKYVVCNYSKEHIAALYDALLISALRG
ncbi:MAG: glycosyltransferase family 4 protein [Anaerolineae bacterium]